MEELLKFSHQNIEDILIIFGLVTFILLLIGIFYHNIGESLESAIEAQVKRGDDIGVECVSRSHFLRKRANKFLIATAILATVTMIIVLLYSLGGG